jgi:hypothetical protein
MAAALLATDMRCVIHREAILELSRIAVAEPVVCEFDDATGVIAFQTQNAPTRV